MEDDAMKKGKRPERGPDLKALRTMLEVLTEQQSYTLRVAEMLTIALDATDRKIRAIRHRIRLMSKGGER